MKGKGKDNAPKAMGKPIPALDKPMKGHEKYRGDAHPMSPVCKQGEPAVWDKRAK